ncbi:cyclic beta 1-2 glucan synthetase [candidate division FCPU426 bacterium]|nr:cyclic beta 1-2 glucan synthetase [candidate division FCPU426 bacterium]
MDENTKERIKTIIQLKIRPGLQETARQLGQEQPLRAELFSVEQMAEFAKGLAGRHELENARGPDRLLPRLDKNEILLQEAYQFLQTKVAKKISLLPAEEWFLDNFHLIEEQIRLARKHLPKSYSRELPALSNGKSAGFPRVYDMALEIVAHGDGRVDAGSISAFVDAYQTAVPLKLGELWAIPIMLRLALIENLRRVAARITAGRMDRKLAGSWAGRMTSIVEKDPKNLVLEMADMARSDPPMSSAFVAELTRHLQGQGPALALPLNWIEQRLSEDGMSIEQLVRMENQRQAEDQVSISNSISSLHFLHAMHWREFVETMSRVEQILRRDPMDVYHRADFITRDACRHRIEYLAKRSHCSEEDIAAKTLELAQTASAQGDADNLEAHVGYYLLDQGLDRLEAQVRPRFTLGERFGRRLKQNALFCYIGAIGFLTLVFAGGVIWHMQEAPRWFWGAAALLLLVIASQPAVALVNWLANRLVRPKGLARMDYSQGLPPEARTLVVVPCMLSHPQRVASLLENLEILYLANRDCRLHFGLVTDFKDAPVENMPEDEGLLASVKDGIEHLNDQYPLEQRERFYLFHRARRWNPREKCWMGWERKRGKLENLNTILLQGIPEKGTMIVGALSILSKMKYVITLDEDTQMTLDSARTLVATMAHPLNWPHVDQQTNRVSRGYGILQPRVGTILADEPKPWFARLFGGEEGIDPYTLAVSDTYQDLFQEGSFVGKGIYEAAVFQKVLAQRLPENRILSHDLLEGGYVRSGLVSDVVLYENYPNNYLADAKRRYRWIRGDWQIARWLMPTVPGCKGVMRNALRMLYRWKIFDNLRRSLVGPATIALLLLGWLSGYRAALITMGVGLVYFLPPVLNACFAFVFRKMRELSFETHGRDTLQNLVRHLVMAWLGLAFLAFEVYCSLGAICRTLFRLWISHRRLLSWTTANDANGRTQAEFLKVVRSMWIAPAFALMVGIMLGWSHPEILGLAGGILGLWFFSPLMTWFIGLPPASHPLPLPSDQRLFLRKLARRTWRFFETFVQESDHFLPLDNVQEQPVPSQAHRASPTNIGLALLANLSAYDFGYISAGQLINRSERTLHTLQSMERFRGHFYNWYDTQTLRPLEPRFISSVDSGNLAGHLLVLRQGLLAMADLPIVPENVFAGQIDTFAVFEEVISRTGPKRSPELKEKIGLFGRHLMEKPGGIKAQWERLKFLETLSAECGACLGSWPEAAWWMHALKLQFQAQTGDIIMLAPWLTLPELPADFWPGVDSQEKPPALDGLRILWQKLLAAPTLREVAELETTLLPFIGADLKSAPTENFKNNTGSGQQSWLAQLAFAATLAANRAQKRMAVLEKLAKQCKLLTDMEYDFLFDPAKNLLAIGYHTREHRRDDGFYDLLASEARLGSFVAIAQGCLPQEHWFSLGRSLTMAAGRPALLSWGGSMFEYLMPLLIMPVYENTLLDQTCKAVVARQIEYGEKRKVFWGISESGYNTTDANHHYQYRAFGVPGLGYKRGLSEDLVIAPYASGLALLVEPQAAARNLQAMARAGISGPYGMYEAVDYTQARLSRGQNYAVVGSYMAHHQGMVLLSLAYCLLDRPMQKRFEAEPEFQAASLLLQERVPKATPAFPHAFETQERRWQAGEGREALMRIFNTPHTPIPEVHLLSNGRYHVMITQAGGGYSRWKDLALTRWREDATLDDYGLFCYIRDVERNETWSAAFQPVKKPGRRYEAIFSQARAEFRRHDLDLDTHTEVTVSPEDDIELRRVRITNRSRVARTLELTSYAEVVLAPPGAEATHPTFNNLFIQTEIIRNRNSILATRRPRSAQENPPWLLHLMVVQGGQEIETSFETDRRKFIGRGRSVDEPLGLEAGRLASSQGAVLDPIIAIRRRIILEAEGTVIVNIVLGATETRESAVALIEKYHDWRLTDRVFELAFSHGQVVLHQLNATEADAQTFGSLAGSVIFSNPACRAKAGVILKNIRGQSGLWSYSISGDLPIVLLRISDPANIDLVRRLVQAHAYWRLKGLAVDLLIWNEDVTGYRELLQDKIMGLISTGLEAHSMDRPAGIFIRRMDQIPLEDQVLMQTAARVIITDRSGSLEDQISRRIQTELSVPAFAPYRVWRRPLDKARDLSRRDLVFFNGLGGFTPDGKEYIVTTTANQMTPMPWSNVLANPEFGTVVSETGSAYTFSENAHEFRLTPWHNDPVCDSSGEAFYIRDEESGRFWSPTPFPARGEKPYACRHGFGYSIFEYTDFGIASEFTTYVAIDAPVKFWILKLRNLSGRPRRLTGTGYVEWVLGELRPKTFMHLVTEMDPQCNAVFARNPFNTEFSGRVAFFDVNDAKRSFTGDRMEFIGRNGRLKTPAAMGRSRLSNRVGPALDPCAGLQMAFEMAEGEEKEIVFMLGAGRNPEHARTLVQRFRGSAPARAALEGVWNYWNRTLSAVHLETPDRSLDILANGWLLYQTIACRLWARSGYYQSGGAFGFRDQLQDALALLHAEPQLLRAHLLRCAEHQFPEGNVQHWWHPPLGRGVRTRCSDDFLWLPYAVCDYVSKTGDTGVLDEKVGFIQGRPLKPEEESYYDIASRSEEKALLYEHCVRAVLHGLRFGKHGLPLMGSGDWNDGMNRVGAQGKGESVWLAFFLYAVLTKFQAIALRRQDTEMALRCKTEAQQLQQRIAAHAWDGEWWLRAFYDNGEPLGSAANTECRIDSLPQSWSILSGAGDRRRGQTAMQAVEKYLVKPASGLIQLCDPPFEKTQLDPGYIRGYVPGVRENGGQYTHAAVWATMAMASLGQKQKAWAWLDLLNPIQHTRTPEEMARYKTEPYVLAGDVYLRAPYTGQGGWTWYTGSAGWMYQCILESLLGLKLDVDKLTLVPCWPAAWDSFQVHYRFRETMYHIKVLKHEPAGAKVMVDGIEQAEPILHLADDRREHWVEFS